MVNGQKGSSVLLPAALLLELGSIPTEQKRKEKLNRSGDNQLPLHRQTPLDSVGSQVILKSYQPSTPRPSDFHNRSATSSTQSLVQDQPLDDATTTACIAPVLLFRVIRLLDKSSACRAEQKCPDTDIEDSVAWVSCFASCNIWVAFDIDFDLVKTFGFDKPRPLLQNLEIRPTFPTGVPSCAPLTDHLLLPLITSVAMIQ